MWTSAAWWWNVPGICGRRVAVIEIETVIVVGMRPLVAKKRLVAVEVQTMDALLEFEMDSRALGRDLLQLVCRTIGLRESCFFGLQFFDSKSNVNWLKDGKRLNEQDVAADRRLPAAPASTTSSTSSVSTATSSSGQSASAWATARPVRLVFHFLAKFFPEDVAQELIQEVTQHLFYLQASKAFWKPEK